MNSGPLTIHCIGDSHASFFSGAHVIQPEWPQHSKDHIPLFQSYRIGPATAYNLTQLNSTTQGREKLFDILRILPPRAKVLLCFGEIDCRVHLLRQAKEQKRPVEDTVSECVDRYMKVVDEIKVMGFDVMIWEVIPSTLNGEIVEKDYVAYGSCRERNYVTQLFNTSIKKAALLRGILTISIFEELVDEQGITDTRWYADKIHVAQRAMPMVIAQICRAFPGERIELFYNPVILKFSFKKQLLLLRVVSYVKTWVFRVLRIKNRLKVLVYKKIKGI